GPPSHRFGSRFARMGRLPPGSDALHAVGVGERGPICVSYLSCALGDGVLAIQARCAANLVHHLIRERNVDPDDLILVGHGLGGVVALLSGALCEDVGGIVSGSSLGCFQFLAEEENVTWPSAAFLPDVLKVLDLPEVVRALAPCQVRIWDPQDAGRRSLSAGEARALYAPAGDHVRIVPGCLSDEEALKQVAHLMERWA
ncbi:MAG: hypothetical protein V1800_17790, partial [Candidatus Latescibacterota bacterium]